MGVELHITRADFWAENDNCQITAEEWLKIIESDPELERQPENGDTFAIWLGPSDYEEPWLDWSNGNISSKWPDTALYRKMLSLAESLGAKVQDDDGKVYLSGGEWEFSPNNPPSRKENPSKPWWRFW